MTCCHYDEGFEDGRRDAQVEGIDIANALRVVARRRLSYGDSVEESRLLEIAASEIEAMPNLDIELRNEEKREARIVEAYREARKQAA